MEENFICPRCHNKDKRYIGYKNGKPYCRLCISFAGKEANIDYKVSKNITLKIDYPLSEKQERIANDVLSTLKEKKNVLINAVTGAGKTELVYYSMRYYLEKGLHVGFATPRKDVVIDLLPRIKESFLNCKVISVYGEHTSILEGDIIVLTTHQLYRYKNYFDLLIVDEIDAFPYANNKLLESFFIDSVRGNYVLLSATPSTEDIKKIEDQGGKIFYLTQRYHHHKIPVPTFHKCNDINAYTKCLILLKKFLKENKPVFIFAPTINIGKKLFSFLNIFASNGCFVSSKEEDRKLIVSSFKTRKYQYLVTTSILERGVTIKDLQVIVFNADHDLYDEKALIQIAGRVGRKIDSTGGEVIFMGNENNDSIRNSINKIDNYNKENNLYD